MERRTAKATSGRHTIAARASAKSGTRMTERRDFKSKSLNDLYRNVDTMRNASTAVTPRKTTRSESVRAALGTAQMSPQSAPAAEGIGRPTNQRLSTTWIWTVSYTHLTLPTKRIV